MDALSSAYTIAFTQAILLGGTYSFFMNTAIDPKKRLRSPPGIISVLGLGRNRKNTITLVPYKLGDLSRVEVKHVRPDNDDCNFCFDIEIFVDNWDKYPYRKCTRNMKQLKNLLRSLPGTSFQKITESEREKSKDAAAMYQEKIQSIIEQLLESHSRESDGIVCDFFRFYIPLEKGDSYKMFIDKPDANIWAVYLMLFGTTISIFFWTTLAAEDMGLTSYIPLLFCLETETIMEVLGRTQRREMFKNAEALQRWLYVVPTLSTILLLFSGIRSLCFFLLVISLRFVMDTCRTMFRILFEDGTIKHSSVIRRLLQLIGGIYSLIPVLVLSAVVSYASNDGMYRFCFLSFSLIFVLGCLYIMLSLHAG